MTYNNSIIEFFIAAVLICVGIPTGLWIGIQFIGILAFLGISLVGYAVMYILLGLILGIPHEELFFGYFPDSLKTTS